MDVEILYFLVMIILGLLLPIYNVFDGPKVKDQLIENPRKLITVYHQTIFIQVFLSFLVFLSMYFNDDPIELIGLSFFKNIGAIVLLLLICFSFLLFINLITISSEDIKELRSKYKGVIYIIPKNKKEFKWSITLAFLVGAFEEILYRGFFYWQLSLFMPMIASLFLTNFIFGMLHFGTGKKNAISTFFLGLFYSALSIPFDTLWFAILAHILTDLYAVSIGFKINNQESQG